jgi:hypothetical protein
VAQNIENQPKTQMSLLYVGVHYDQVCYNRVWLYSQTYAQRPPLGPEKSSRLTEVSDKTKI